MRKVEKSAAEVEMDMTPMIDCVFLLIIFFMIVSEISALDLEEVALPGASKAEKLASPDRALLPLIVNIKKSGPGKGELRVAGRTFTKEELCRLVREKVLMVDPAQNEPNAAAPDGKPPLSPLEVYIRADRDVPEKYVQEVFELCQRPLLDYPVEQRAAYEKEVPLVWKIAIATKQKGFGEE